MANFFSGQPAWVWNVEYETFFKSIDFCGSESIFWQRCQIKLWQGFFQTGTRFWSVSQNWGKIFEWLFYAKFLVKSTTFGKWKGYLRLFLQKLRSGSPCFLRILKVNNNWPPTTKTFFIFVSVNEKNWNFGCK